MPQKVSRRYLVLDWFLSRASTIFGGQSGFGTDLSPKLLLSPVTIIQPMLRTHISFIYY